MIQGDVSTSDILVGAAVLAVLLPVLYFIGKLLNKFKNSRFEKAWRPIESVLDGAEVVPDQGGGGASSWLTGTYRGVPVFAQMTPNVGKGGSLDTRGHENRWDTGVRDLAGANDWSVIFREALLGFGTTGWTIDSDDAALTERLEHAGLREIAARVGRGEFRYRVEPATLVLHQDIRPLWVPLPDRFRTELDVLVEMAALSAKANAR